MIVFRSAPSAAARAAHPSASTSSSSSSSSAPAPSAPAHAPPRAPPSSSPLSTAARDLCPARLESPRAGAFPFPYGAPYAIQLDLMRHIFTAIRTRRVGIFESPTGTGKTLSVVCASLQWLREHQAFGDNDDDDGVGGGGGGGGGAGEAGAGSSATRGGGSVPEPQRPAAAAAASAADASEPDWCVNYEAEKGAREKAQTLARARGYRDALAQRLAAIRFHEPRGGDSSGVGAGGGGAAPSRLQRGERRIRARQRLLARCGGGGSGGAAGKRWRDHEADGGESGADASGADGGEGSVAAGDEGDDHLVPPEYHSGPESERESGSEASDGGAGGTGCGTSRHCKGAPTAHSATSVGMDASSVTMSIADRIRLQVAAESRGARGGASALSSSSSAFASGLGADDDGEDAEETAAFRPKVFFVSRTHSQISQFVREVGRTSFGRDVRVVALGSRRNLCVHPGVSALASDARVNERCLELQDEARKGPGTGRPGAAASLAATAAAAAAALASGAASAGGSSLPSLLPRAFAPAPPPHAGPGCPYLDSGAQEGFRNRLLAGLRDVEEAAELGWEAGTCAYYGSRKAVRFAEVVAMPYSMLLHAGTRAAAGIDAHLRGSVVIIDEAHNIIDAIASTHAAVVTLPQLRAAHAMVRAYLARYRARMLGSNVLHCAMLADALQALVSFLARTSAAPQQPPVAGKGLGSDGGLGRPAPGASPVAGSAFASALPPRLLPPTRPPTPAPSTAEAQALQPLAAAPARSISPLNFWAKAPAQAPGPALFSTVSAPPLIAGAATVAQADDAREHERLMGMVAAASSALATAASAPSSSSASSQLIAESVRVFAPTPSTALGAPGGAGAGANAAPTQLFTTSDFLSRAGLDGTTYVTVAAAAGLAAAAGAAGAAAEPATPAAAVGVPLNLFRVRRYVEAVQLLRKLRGFAELGARAAQAQQQGGTVAIHARERGRGAGHGVPVQGHGHGPQPLRGQSLGPRTGGQSAPGPAAGSTVADDNEAAGPFSDAERGDSGSGAGAGGYMAAVAGLQASWAFLECLLMGPDGDGRIVVNRVGSGGALGGEGAAAHSHGPVEPFYKFVLLNPAMPFRAVVDRARSVILVGGTMQPIADISEQLFGHLAPHRVMTFSCGHIIPRDNMAAFTLARGPTGATLDFRHAARATREVMDELGRALTNLAALVPGGMVVFVSSYEYLRTLLAHWTRAPAHADGAMPAAFPSSSSSSSSSSIAAAATIGAVPAGAPGSVLAQLARRKRLFAEPRSAAEVDAVLGAYAQACGVGTVASDSASGAAAGRTLAASTAPAYAGAGSGTEDGFGPGGFGSPGLELPSSRPPSRPASVCKGGGGGDGGGGGGVDGGCCGASSGGEGEGVPPPRAALPPAMGAAPRPGALLFSVVGGKMSEGINFSDDLARCVAVVGLPYPNPSDPELVERMAYLDRRAAAAAAARGVAGSGGGTGHGGGGGGGREYYENVTVRAVNQAIGRSIRHSEDYAVIALLDFRYQQPRIRAKLPSWIGERLQSAEAGGAWGPAVAGVGAFFRNKRRSGDGGGGVA